MVIHLTSCFIGENPIVVSITVTIISYCCFLVGVSFLVSE